MILRTSTILFLSFLIISTGCETEKETKCYPSRVTRKIALGNSTKDIIADYKYENELLDRIIRSDFQTHYYEYNEGGNVAKVSRKNVQTYQNLQSQYSYDGELPEKSDEYLVLLDRFTQEDKESTQTGYREFVYDGMNVVEEKIYEVNDSLGGMELTLLKEYEYDLSGNIIKYVSLEQPSNDTVEAFSYIYDSYPNSYSALNLAFEGESYVNNILQKTDLMTDEVYDYQILYYPSGYPDQKIIKLGTYMSEIIKFEYTCR